jgi:hypothetical protein
MWSGGLGVSVMRIDNETPLDVPRFALSVCRVFSTVTRWWEPVPQSRNRFEPTGFTSVDPRVGDNLSRTMKLIVFEAVGFLENLIVLIPSHIVSSLRQMFLWRFALAISWTPSVYLMLLRQPRATSR